MKIVGLSIPPVCGHSFHWGVGANVKLVSEKHITPPNHIIIFSSRAQKKQNKINAFLCAVCNSH